MAWSRSQQDVWSDSGVTHEALWMPAVCVVRAVSAGLLRCVSTAATRVMNTRRQAPMVQRRWAHAGTAIKWHAQATVDP